MDVRAYHSWTSEEEDALRRGVEKHGLGSWEVIRKDEEFGLTRRTGVQLKDKWRNLVKFRHISVTESKQLKPKTSGPWSKKHSACASKAKPRRPKSKTPTDPPPDPFSTLQPSAAAEEASAELHRPEPSPNDLALVPAANEQEESGGDEDDDEGEEGCELEGKRSGRGSKRLFEDKRFGIYDQRRYGLAGGGSGEKRRRGGGSGPSPSSRSMRKQRQRSGGKRQKRGGSIETDTDMDSEEIDASDYDKDEDEEDGPGNARLKKKGGGNNKRKNASQLHGLGNHQSGYEFLALFSEAREAQLHPNGIGSSDKRIVCPCGAAFEDGLSPLVQCQGPCCSWAHSACLLVQAQLDPLRYGWLDLQAYLCDGCMVNHLAHGQGQLARPPPPPPPPLSSQEASVQGEDRAGGSRGRTSRIRKASSRYGGGDFVAEEEEEDAAGGTKEGVPKAGAGVGGGGGLIDPLKASTLHLLADHAALSNGGLGGGWRPLGGGAGNNSRLSLSTFEDPKAELSLLLSSSSHSSGHGRPQQGSGLTGLTRVNSLNGLGSFGGLEINGGVISYPGRTASPATAALAAAAAMAMKQHEHEEQKKKAGGLMPPPPPPLSIPSDEHTTLPTSLPTRPPSALSLPSLTSHHHLLSSLLMSADGRQSPFDLEMLSLLTGVGGGGGLRGPSPSLSMLLNSPLARGSPQCKAVPQQVLGGKGSVNGGLGGGAFAPLTNTTSSHLAPPPDHPHPQWQGSVPQGQGSGLVHPGPSQTPGLLLGSMFGSSSGYGEASEEDTLLLAGLLGGSRSSTPFLGGSLGSGLGLGLGLGLGGGGLHHDSLSMLDSLIRASPSLPIFTQPSVNLPVPPSSLAPPPSDVVATAVREGGGVGGGEGGGGGGSHHPALGSSALSSDDNGADHRATTTGGGGDQKGLIPPPPPFSATAAATAPAQATAPQAPAPIPIAFKSEEVAAMQMELAQIMTQHSQPSPPLPLPLLASLPSSSRPPSRGGVIQPTPLNPGMLFRALSPAIAANPIAAASAVAAKQMMLAQVQASAMNAAIAVASVAHAAVMAGGAGGAGGAGVTSLPNVAENVAELKQDNTCAAEKES